MYDQTMENSYQDQHREEDIKSQCKKYMNYHVMAQMRDGSQFDGIITEMDEDGVSMLVPEWVDEGQMSRQYNYGYGGYGRRRFRRFRRRRFPFSFFLFPFFRPYPYYYPYY